MTYKETLDKAANLAASYIKGRFYENNGLAIHVAAKHYYNQNRRGFENFRSDVSKILRTRYNKKVQASRRKEQLELL